MEEIHFAEFMGDVGSRSGTGPRGAACLPGAVPPLHQPWGAELLPVEVAGMELALSPPPMGGVVPPPALLEPGSPWSDRARRAG